MYLKNTPHDSEVAQINSITNVVFIFQLSRGSILETSCSAIFRYFVTSVKFNFGTMANKFAIDLDDFLVNYYCYSFNCNH